MQRCDLGPDPENALRRDRSFMGIGPGRGDRCGGRIARASLGKAGPPVVRCLAGGLGKSMIRTGSRRSYCGSTYGRAGIGHVRGSLRCAKSHRTSASIYVVLYPSSLVRLPSDPGALPRPCHDVCAHCTSHPLSPSDAEVEWGKAAGERALWALGGLVSIALGVVLAIRPDIGAVTLARVFGLFSIVSGISALVVAAHTRRANTTTERLAGSAK
jgi:short repeat uncharacterized protein DUF308